ncbi:MAG: 4-hydroxy-tetrahydrodipicolinate synthase [Maricaulis sp.]|jgi:4-hydroxy-tetrahydrodipicolinate synthase|nr:4-hydroxy-tetrahydrodipicolinate synthase [Maricaulis sp.]HAQ36690.1 4-hydroxy-tetrahydrodipicolinate synthase [Alphaproteobacteria bacterium]
MFRGSLTALVTPFKNGAVDRGAFEALVERQIAAGTHGLVPMGTTGESPTLTKDEHFGVVAHCIEIADGRVPVIAGTGSNSTDVAIANQRHAKELGAQAGLVVTPYYNKPSQDGLFAHYKAINDAVDLPIIVYNIPGRSVVDISNTTMARIAGLSHVIGVKDATADLTRVSALRHLIGPDFVQLSGEDGTALAYNAAGGAGCISVTANVAPELCAQLQDATRDGRFNDALAIQDKLWPLHRALFLAPNPGPAKYALSLLGLCRDELRLPLVGPDDSVRTEVRAAMKHAGLM